MPESYRSFLKDVLAERQGRNPKYSIRSFARDLKINISQLIDVLNGKQGISPARARQIAEILCWGPKKREQFCFMVQAEHGRSRTEKTMAKAKLISSRFKPVSKDVISFISDWYHIAIIELTKVRDFKSDLRWISERLQIKEKEAQEAIDRMIRLGLLMNKDGVLKPTSADLETSDDVSSEAIRNLHRQMLMKAITAVSQPIDQRELQLMIFAGARSDIGKMKVSIREFCKQFDVVHSSREADSVFALGIQLHDLTVSGGV